MPSPSSRIGLLMVVALTLLGCVSTEPKVITPLAAARMSPQSVVLEIFFVRFPFGDPQANGPLWEEIDEQHFAADLRGRLGRNGFRVGLVGSQIPVKLSQLLELKDKPPPTGEATEAKLPDLQAQPKVVRRHTQTRCGQCFPILASHVYDRLPVLIPDSGQLSGQTYEKAQGMLAVTAFAERDGRVKLQVMPELEYGENQQRWVGNQGKFMLKTGRSKRAFDELTLSATLSPGHMLVLASLPNRRGSVGHYFFTEDDSGQLEQKLLVIRLSQTQHDDLFDPQETLPLGRLEE